MTSPTRPDKRKWCVLNVVGAKWILSKRAKCTNATAEIRLSYYYSHNLSKLHAVSIMQCDFCENTKDAKGLWHAAGDRPTQNLWRITATGRHLQFVSFMDTVTVLGTPLPDNTMSRRSFSKVSWRTSSFKKSLEKSPLWRCLALRKYPNHWLEEQFFKL